MTDQITIRIDLGAAEVHLAGGVLKSAPVSIEVPMSRAALATLIMGEPVFQPMPVQQPAPEPIVEAPLVAVEAAPTPVIAVEPPVVEVEPPVIVLPPPTVSITVRRPRALAHVPDDVLKATILRLGVAPAAEHYKVSVATIHNERKRLGMVTPREGYKQMPRQASAKARVIESRPERSLNDVSDVELRQLLASGKPWEKIAEEHGTTLQRLSSRPPPISSGPSAGRCVRARCTSMLPVS